MRSITSGSTVVFAALAFGLACQSVPAAAQCTHITGTPPPTAAPLLASKVTLRKGAGGAFGDGNDRFKLLKGFLPTAAAVDLATTDSFHITIRHTDDAGPTMLAISLPPGAPWTPFGFSSFLYLDPLATLGVRKIILKNIGLEYVYKTIGKNVSILNTPVLTGDTIHLMIEIENGGVGECFGAILNCTATSGGANCF